MSAITLLVDDPGWRKPRGLVTNLRRAAEAALATARLKGGITVLLSNDARLKSLNHDFRGKNKPTNVLSFATDGRDGHRGDIAIAYGVAAREAKASGKTLTHHAAHLVVHGVLHLAGYDHETPRDAQVMEPLEVKILKKLGIADPYKVVA